MNKQKKIPFNALVNSCENCTKMLKLMHKSLRTSRVLDAGKKEKIADAKYRAVASRNETLRGKMKKKHKKIMQCIKSKFSETSFTISDIFEKLNTHIDDKNAMKKSYVARSLKYLAENGSLDRLKYIAGKHARYVIHKKQADYDI